MQTNLQILNQLLTTLNHDAVTRGNEPLTIQYLTDLASQPNQIANAFLIPDLMDYLELIDGEDIRNRANLTGTVFPQPNSDNFLYDFQAAKDGIDDMKPYTLQEFIDEINIMDLTFA